MTNFQSATTEPYEKKIICKIKGKIVEKKF